MFKIGDAVVYQSAGLCIIEDIRTENFLGKDELFYVISPVYSKGSTIFSPVENAKVTIRCAVTKEELSNILSVKSDFESEWIDNNHERHNFFSEVLRSCDLSRILGAVKMLNLKKSVKEKAGKKLHMADEKSLAELEKMLYGEVSYVLGIGYDETVQMLQMNMGCK